MADDHSFTLWLVQERDYQFRGSQRDAARRLLYRDAEHSPRLTGHGERARCGRAARA